MMPLNPRLKFPATPIDISTAQPLPAIILPRNHEQRRNRTSMRRRGQSGNLIQQTGWWKVRFRLDQPGTDDRKQMSVKVAPIVLDKKGRPKSPSSEIRRKAREIIEQHGVNSEERFNQVVWGDVTFREQAKAYLRWQSPKTQSSP
jgi:glutaredoxin-related protein